MSTTDPLTSISTRRTPQREQADPAQTRNSAGGFTFTVDDLTRFRRFLATGTEGGTFYATESQHTAENAEVVLRLARSDQAGEMLNAIYAASVGGHTVKQQPLMLSLAAVVGLAEPFTRARALALLPEIARTATHLFLFAGYVEQFRGWGRGLRRGVANWYAMEADSLAYQMAKYQQREGYTHRDVLRLAHPRPASRMHKALFDEACGRTVEFRHPLMAKVSALNAADSVREVTDIIDRSDVSWEMVPSRWLGEPDVWRALVDRKRVPIGALIRQLPRLTNLGVLDYIGDDRTTGVIGRLVDPQVLTKGRVHPMTMLLAAATYASGRSVRGSSTWKPVPGITRALNMGFERAFGAIEPDDETRAMLCVDVSGSMDTHSVAGLPLSCRTAAVALAQCYAAQFPRNMGLAFTGPDLGTPGRGYSNNPSWVEPFDVDPGRSLTDLVAQAQQFPFGRTDCAAPVLFALERGIKVNAFIIATDNETWAGEVHPHQALRQYRERTGIPARMVTVSMQANHSTIADPNDPGMLDVVGLDASTVGVVADFARGRLS